MPSPHGGYYTSLLSENYQDHLGHEDYVDVENEEVMLMLRMKKSGSSHQ
jgi:hypothetical protein